MREYLRDALKRVFKNMQSSRSSKVNVSVGNDRRVDRSITASRRWDPLFSAARVIRHGRGGVVTGPVIEIGKIDAVGQQRRPTY